MPGVKGLGYAMLLVNWMITIVYAVLVAWAFVYIQEVKYRFFYN